MKKTILSLEKHVVMNNWPEEPVPVVCLVKTLNRPIYGDVDGKNIIVTVASEYLKGEKTLEQAVDEMEQKYSIYLSE